MAKKPFVQQPSFFESTSSDDPFIKELLSQKIDHKYQTPLEEFQVRFAALAKQNQWVIHQEALAKNRAIYEGIGALHKKWANVTGQSASDTQFISIFHAPKDKSLISAANKLMQAGFPSTQEEEDKMFALANKFNKDFDTAPKQLHIAAPRDVVLDLLKEKDGLDIHKSTREFIYGDPTKAAYRENLFHTLITTHEGLEAYNLPKGFKADPSLMSATIGSHVSMDVVKSDFKAAEILGIDALELMSRYRRDELEYLSANPISEFSIVNQEEYVKQLSGVLNDVDKYVEYLSDNNLETIDAMRQPEQVVSQSEQIVSQNLNQSKKRTVKRKKLDKTHQHIQERIKERKSRRQKARIDKLETAAAEIPIDLDERDRIPFTSEEYNKKVRPSRAINEQVNKELEVPIDELESRDAIFEEERLKEERWKQFNEELAEQKYQRNIKEINKQSKRYPDIGGELEYRDESYLKDLAYEETTPEQQSIFAKEKATARQQQTQVRQIARELESKKQTKAVYEKMRIASRSKINDLRAEATKKAAEWEGARVSRWSGPTAAATAVEEKVAKNIFAKANRIPKGHLIAAGAALLWIGSQFSGKDDEYNTIEGLPHGGLAEQQRKLFTDFGSGCQGLWKGKLAIPKKGDPINPIEGMPHGGLGGKMRSEGTDHGSKWKGWFGGVSRKISKYMASGRNTIYSEMLPVPKNLLDPRKAAEMMKTHSLEEIAAKFNTKLTIVKDAESQALYENLLKGDKGFAGGAASYVSKSGEYSILLHPEILSKQFTDVAVKRGITREAAEAVTKSDDFLNTVFYHELLEQQARTMFTNRTVMPTGHVSAHVLIGEGGFVQASKNTALKDFFVKIRSKSKEETAALYAGFEAFGETGVSAKLRKLISDFGSGYRGLLKSTSLKAARYVCLNKRASYNLVSSSKDLKVAQKQIWTWANGGGKRHNRYAGSHVKQLSKFGGSV